MFISFFSVPNETHSEYPSNVSSVAFTSSDIPHAVELPQVEAGAFEPISTSPEPVIPAILEKIAFCESGGKQFNADGSVLQGRVDPRDTGKWQINKYYHLKESQRLGMDIETLAGNTAYALHLYETQGTRPWNASKNCWSKK